MSSELTLYVRSDQLLHTFNKDERQTNWQGTYLVSIYFTPWHVYMLTCYSQQMFSILSVVLACQTCRDEGKASECVHMLHLVPRWQSGQRHTRLKTIMQDRPDLIVSELSGYGQQPLYLAVPACLKTGVLTLCVQACVRFIAASLPSERSGHHVFAKGTHRDQHRVHLYGAYFERDGILRACELNLGAVQAIDPAAGGPQSDYALVSITRHKGMISVRFPSPQHAFTSTCTTP